MDKTDPISAKRIGQVGQQIYERLRAQLEPRYAGKIVAIDVDSEDYFVGDTLQEAIDKGRKRYPGKVFYSVKWAIRSSTHSPVELLSLVMPRQLLYDL